MRHGFGPIEREDVGGLVSAGLIDANLQTQRAHPKSLGPVDKLDFLAC